MKPLSTVTSMSQSEITFLSHEDLSDISRTTLGMKRLNRLLKIDNRLGLLCLFLPGWEGYIGVRVCTSVPLQPRRAEDIERQMSVVSCDAPEEDQLGSVEFSTVDQVINATCVHYIHTLCTRCRRYKALPITLPAHVYKRLIQKWSRRSHPAIHSKTHARCCSPGRCLKTSSESRGAQVARVHQSETKEMNLVNNG